MQDLRRRHRLELRELDDLIGRVSRHAEPRNTEPDDRQPIRASHSLRSLKINEHADYILSADFPRSPTSIHEGDARDRCDLSRQTSRAHRAQRRSTTAARRRAARASTRNGRVRGTRQRRPDHAPRAHPAGEHAFTEVRFSALLAEPLVVSGVLDYEGAGVLNRARRSSVSRDDDDPRRDRARRARRRGAAHVRSAPRARAARLADRHDRLADGRRLVHRRTLQRHDSRRRCSAGGSTLRRSTSRLRERLNDITRRGRRRRAALLRDRRQPRRRERRCCSAPLPRSRCRSRSCSPSCSAAAPRNEAQRQRPCCCSSLGRRALAALGLLVERRLDVGSDLRLFLPTPTTQEQRLLLDAIGEGPASRLLVVALEGAPAEALAAASGALVDALRGDERFRFVANGDVGLDSMPAELLPYRYLLSARRRDAGARSRPPARRARSARARPRRRRAASRSSR